MMKGKKILSLLLAVLFLLPGVSVGLTASAEGAVTFSVVPDETTAHPGDTITYSVYMDPVTGLDGLQLTLGLPDGLTFGQADTNTNLLNAMSATCPEFSISFYESSLTLFIFTISTSEHFTSTENDVLMRFTCTVDEGASGAKTIDLPKHIVSSRTGGGTVPTEYDSTDSVVTIMPAPPVKAIELVTGGAAANIAGAQKSSVYFGNYKQSSDGGDGYNVDPVKWRVLSNADGKLFLLSDQNLDVVRYNETNTDVTWESCTLRKWLNGYDGHPYDDTFIGSAFSDKEAAAITETAVANDDNSGKDTTDKVFLLSLAEVKNTAYGFTDNNSATDTRKATNTAYVAAGGHTGSTVVYSEGTADWWWLRSLYADGVTAFVVADSGNLNGEFSNVASKDTAVRPALNVDLGKVLFTSAAENGKQGDGLTAVGGYTGSDWKLTVLDESRSGFTAKCTGIENGVYTIQYSGAATGTNEKISAMIVSADGAVTYYGVLEAAKAGENTLTLDVNGKLQSGDTLYVFNEQVNGDKMTDYAGALQNVTDLYHYKAGDTLQYGTYPQSEVTDAATVAALNAKLRSNGWISYGYYIGTGGYNGEMAPGDFMRYQDVALDGVKYRAVTFDGYRPSLTKNVSSAANSNQDENGYEPGNTYWFRFEPVTWKVLDPDSGLVLCCSAIDAQAYHNYVKYIGGVYWGDAEQKYRANDYARSSIRAWLNEDFINTAFSAAQQENITVSELDNSLANSGSDTYVYASTSDKIFLPSVSDVTAYIFDPNASAMDEARRMAPSDYAKCQGIMENTTKTSFWWLRAPRSINDISVHATNPYGSLDSYGSAAAIDGVVPALRMQELQDDPTGAPLKVAPEMTLTAEPVIYGEDAVITAALPANATGSVTFTLTGSSNNYSFTNDSITDGVAQITQKLNADSYTVTATYSGDGQYLTTTATATLTVNPATPEITITAKSLNDAGTAYEITVTKPADSTQGVMVYAVYSGLPAFVLGIGNDKFENGSYTFRFPDVFEDYLSDNVSGEFELSAVYDGRNDQNYQDNIVELAITLGCAHVWNTPTWDWTDVDNPTYSTTCTLCANGQTSGSVTSTPGTRVEATGEADAYTPYTATVTLDGQTFNDTFNLTEPGTMLAARKVAFDQYKADQKQAADAMAKTGDSAACAALIDAAKSAIDGVTYDESKSLDENKAAVDAAANLDQLAADLTDQRAADEVEKKINDIGTVALTDESNQKIDDAKEAYNNLTDAQKALVGNKDTLETAEEAYQLLEDKDSFEQYKDELKQAAEDKRKDGDSAESKKLIDDAIAAIDGVTYDESKSLDENKQAVDTAADLGELTEQLEEHRAVYYAVFKADGVEVASIPYTIDTVSVDEPAVPVKDNYTGAWPQYELKAGGVEIDAVYTKNGALVITDNAKEQGEGRVLTFMETVTFTTDTSALPEGATLCWYVNGEAVTAEKSVTVESPKDDYTVQVKAFAKDGTLYTESEVLTVKVDHSIGAKLIAVAKLSFTPVFNSMKKVVPSFFSFLIALIKAIATALVAVVKSVI